MDARAIESHDEAIAKRLGITADSLDRQRHRHGLCSECERALMSAPAMLQTQIGIDQLEDRWDT